MDLYLWLTATCGGLSLGCVIWIILRAHAGRVDPLIRQLGQPTTLTDDATLRGFTVLDGYLEATKPQRRSIWWAMIVAALATASLAWAISTVGARRSHNASAGLRSDDDLPERRCRWSFGCVVFGRCSPDPSPDQTCRALSEQDCAGSRNCELFGQCHAEDGWCWGPAGHYVAARQLQYPRPYLHRGGSVEHGPPVTYGGLSAAIVMRVVARHINEVKYCQLQLMNPRLRGEMWIRFTIAPTGRVAHSMVSPPKIMCSESVAPPVAWTMWS